MSSADKLNEVAAAKAFSRQSSGFDEYDKGNAIIQYKRRRVREHVLRYMGGGAGAPGGGSILELNAGTGEDAAYFARQGYMVHATDISEGMQERLMEKMRRLGLEEWVSTELCSFNSLDELKARGPYDLIFSNFAGLNCTDRLDEVLHSLSPLVKPGGQVTLVILPGFCLWESLLVFRGKFRTAVRRWKGSAKSRVEGIYFKSWYYSPGYVRREMGPDFELLGLEGLCTVVPPSYMEGFAGKRPKLYEGLCQLEDRWKLRWPWRSIGDYYIISFRRK
ncbi:MAG TPA: class I SAM-dependent methyltransferase [Puia sp.]